MLTWIRDRSNSFMVKVIFFCVALSFVVGFGISSSMIAGQQSTGPQAARVYDETVPLGRYQNQVNSLAQSRSRLGEIDPSEIRREALDTLIRQAALIHQAKSLGMRVTDRSLQKSIQKTPSFLNQATGKFDRRLYDELYASDSAKVNFEAGTRDSILFGRIAGVLQALAQASPAEIEEEYNRSSATMRLGLIKLTPSEMALEVDPSEEALRKHYEDNQEDYRIAERRKVEFLAVYLDQATPQPEISDAEIEARYEADKADYATEEEVKANHILLKLDEGADEATVEKRKEEILALLEKARGGEDFEELAKTHSEGPSGPRGGDLGFFGRGKMVKAFEDAAFAAQPGDITEPVQTQFGWHIIQVVERKAAGFKPLDEVSDAIGDQLAEEKKAGLGEETLKKFDDAVAGGDLQAAAESLDGAELHTTDFFEKKALALENVEAAMIYSFREKAFATEVGEISERFGNDLVQYYVRPLEVQPERLPTYEEVSDQIAEDLGSILRADEAEKQAEAWLAAWKAGEDLAETKAEEPGVEYLVTDAFPIGGFVVPQIGYNETFNEERYGLTEEEPFLSKPIRQGEKSIFLAKMVERLPPDLSGLAAEKENIKRRLVGRKGAAFTTAFMDNAVKKAREDGAVHEFVQTEEPTP